SASGSSVPGQSRADPYASNMAPTPCAPSSDRANRRSAAPDDRAEPPCRDQTNRKTVPVLLPAAPSCAAPADAVSTNGIMVRDSHQREFCNTIRSTADTCEEHQCSPTPATGTPPTPEAPVSPAEPSRSLGGLCKREGVQLRARAPCLQQPPPP